jgi:hypothetical protein
VINRSTFMNYFFWAHLMPLNRVWLLNSFRCILPVLLHKDDASLQCFTSNVLMLPNFHTFLYLVHGFESIVPNSALNSLLPAGQAPVHRPTPQKSQKRC